MKKTVERQSFLVPIVACCNKLNDFLLYDFKLLTFLLFELNLHHTTQTTHQ